MKKLIFALVLVILIISGSIMLAGGVTYWDEPITTSAAVSGAAKVITATAATTLTNAQYGSILLMTTTGEVTLPDVCDRASGAFYIIVTRDAEKIEVVFTDTSDQFVLDGTALTAGNELDSAGGAGNFATIACLATNTWHVLGKSGIWVDGGAAD